MRRYVVPVTVDESGDAEVYTPRVRGFLESIQYVKDDFADGVDFTITDEETGESLWTDTNINASEIVRPRAPLHSQAGAALLYASGGTAVPGKIAISGRIKIVVAAGGDETSGSFTIIVSQG